MPDRELIFLLGAGASVEAGIPDVRSFVKKFREKLDSDSKQKKGEEQNRVLKKIEVLNLIDERLRLKKFPYYYESLDLELLLGTLIKLRKREEEILTYFCEKPIENLSDYDEYFEELEKELKTFIRMNCNVSSDKLDYLEPLIDFQKIYGKLDIFTLNYDMCIEILCEKNGVKYTDGFEQFWNRDLFEEPKNLRLFKIHGSVVWYYLPGKGALKKIPVIAQKEPLIDYTGEKTEEVIIYPTIEKNVLVKPFFYIFYKFSERLNEVGLCVVIGYSFRDEYVKGKIIEAMKENEELYLYVVDPNVYNVDPKKSIIERICSQNPEFRTRIIPLKETTGKALGGAKLKRNIETIFNAIEKEREARVSKIGQEYGDPSLWLACLKFWFELGHFVRFNNLLEEIYERGYLPEKEFPPVYVEYLDSSLQKAVEYYSKGNLLKAKGWFTCFRAYAQYLRFSVALDRRNEGRYSGPTIFKPVEKSTYITQSESRFDASKLFSLRDNFEKIITGISRENDIYKKLARIRESLEVLCDIEKKRSGTGEVDKEILQMAKSKYEGESLEICKIVDEIIDMI